LNKALNIYTIVTIITYKSRCRITGIQRGETSKVRGRTGKGV